MTDTPTPTVLVVGGSGVIGQALGKCFAQNHWNVGVHYHTQQTQAQRLVQAIHRDNGQAKAFSADVGINRQVMGMMDEVIKEWGRLDVLVYAVGTNLNRFTIRLHTHEWETILHANLTGLFHCLKAVGPMFHHQGSGSIMIIGSLSGTQGGTGQTAYAASKAGLVGLVKSVAKEWGMSHIRINVIFPGWQPSPLSQGALARHDFSNQVLGLPPRVADVSNLAFQIATTCGISGQIFNLDNRIV